MERYYPGDQYVDWVGLSCYPPSVQYAKNEGHRYPLGRCVDLDEFTDEIDEWIIDELKKVGCDTAKSVLRLSKEELVRRTDLEEETIDDVVKILREEFED